MEMSPEFVCKECGNETTDEFFPVCEECLDEQAYYDNTENHGWVTNAELR